MSAAPVVTITGPLASVTFDRFDLDAYRLFLATKRLPESQVEFEPATETYRVTTPARFAPLLGAAVDASERPGLPLAGHLFDYQQFVVERALTARRFACWADTGLGKTTIALEYIRQVIARTAGRVLILVPTIELIDQWQDEARHWYGDDLRLTAVGNRAAVAAWCQQPGPAVGLATYATFVPGVMPELRYLAGLVADESSILKTGGGTIKWNLIKSARGLDYKLSLTATPAPNDTMEYASQAAFLEKLRTEADILWTFFTRDKHGDWSVKPHARAAFYRFMASWSIYLRNPTHFGFRDILAGLPPPDVREYRLDMTPEQAQWRMGFLVERGRGFFDDRQGVKERSKLSQLAKGFLYSGPAGAARTATRLPSHKPSFVADLIRQEVAAGHQVLVWTVFDEESAILAELLGDLPGVGVLHGSMTDTQRLDTLRRFRAGNLAALISKAQLIGYGLNFQFVRAMVFSGFDDSMERFYQAVRRAYRFGQTQTVRVHIPVIPELEGLMWENVQAKQRRFDDETTEMERLYRLALEDRS